MISGRPGLQLRNSAKALTPDVRSIIEFWLPNPAKERSAFDHRRLERRITVGTTAGLFLLWLGLNCWMYIEGLNRFLLSGADYMTFGQVEQVCMRRLHTWSEPPGHAAEAAIMNAAHGALPRPPRALPWHPRLPEEP